MTDYSSPDSGTDGQQERTGQLAYEIDPDEPPSEAVVRAVAAFTQTGLLELDPLYDVVDPGHLDGLFGEASGTAGSFAFVFNDCEVTVTCEEVRVAERDSH